jgi:cytochrome oxidase Cu insertion factor (SCO1/SenC/PrrC family)
LETVLVVSSVLLWLVVLLSLLLTLVLVRRLNAQSHPEQVVGLKGGQHAPDFTALTLSGEAVRLAIYAGRKVTFLFISTHCRPCQDLLPLIESLGPKAVRAGIELVLVSGDEMEETRVFVEKQNICLPPLSRTTQDEFFYGRLQIHQYTFLLPSQ